MRRGIFWRVAAVVMAMLFAPSLQAAQVTLTAQYLGGGSGRFENTTPPATFCQRFATLCRLQMTVDVPISYEKRTVHGTGDPRKDYFLKLPGRRQIDVYHQQTGELQRMNFEFQHVTQDTLNRGNFSYAPLHNGFKGGCSRGSALISHKLKTIAFYTSLLDRQQPQPCWSVNSSAPAGTVIDTTVREMGVSYLLEFPPPYRLRSGVYRGSATYTIGPGGDFDFGDEVTALSDNVLTIDFELDVQHAFIFDFPPGSEHAVLEPRDGWQAWLSGGRVPQRLYRDLPFRLWSTGPFRVYKLCQYASGTTCALRNASAHQVPVQVSMTLPSGIRHLGREVQHLALPTGRRAALQFEAAMPTVNRLGQLHFEIVRDDVPGMLSHPGSVYGGDVTVILDSEL